MNVKEHLARTSLLIRDQSLIQQVLTTGASFEQINEFVPQVRPYTKKLTGLSTEGLFFGEFSDDDAEKAASGIITFFGKIFKVILALSRAIWKRIWSLGKQLSGFFRVTKKKFDDHRKGLAIVQNEGRKLVQATNEYCDKQLASGTMNDINLINAVNLITQSTGTKTRPIIEDSPVSVKQWLASIDYSKPSPFKLGIEGLKYTAPSYKYHLYGFHRNRRPLDLDHLKSLIELSDNYIKLIFSMGTNLSAESVLGKVSGNTLFQYKQRLTPNEMRDHIIDSLMEPFMNLQGVYFDGNLTPYKRFTLPNKSIRSIYTTAKDKLTGMKEALLSYQGVLSDTNPREFIQDSNFETDVPELVKYSETLNRTLGKIEVNKEHLFGTEATFSKNIIRQDIILKIINILTYEGDPNAKEVVRMVTTLIKEIDDLMQKYYLYFTSLVQAKLLWINQAQASLDLFIPVI